MKLKRISILSQALKNNWFLDIISLSIVLMALYTFWLGTYPLFTPDEGRYSEVAREMIATHDYITPRVNGVAFLDKPIFYYWLQAFAIHLFGLKEWALRLAPAFVGIFGCLMTYACGRSFYDRRTGILAAIILASNLLYFGHAHYANLDLEVAVFISASLLIFITAIHINKPRLIYAAYFFSALAFLTKGLIGIMFPIMIIGSWIILQWRFTILKKMKILTGLILFIIVVLPWYSLVQQANPEFLHFFFVTQQVTRFLSKAEFNNQSPYWFYLPVIIAGFFPWTIFLTQAVKYHLRNIKQSVNLFLLLWAIIVLIFFSIPHSKIIGYILPLFPPLALIVAHYLSLHWETIEIKSLRFATFCFQCLSLLFATVIWLALRENWLNLSGDGVFYLKCIAVLLTVSAMIAFALYRQKTITPLFLSCVGLSLSIFFILLLGANTFNQNSTKPLTAYLKTIIKPGDEVITYYKFYHDAPLYLEKRITIVNDWQSPGIVNKDNWARELWFGMPFQNTSEWLIGENTFWQRWQSNRNIYVLLNNNYLAQFKSHTHNYFILAKYNDVILLSNHMIEPTNCF